MFKSLDFEFKYLESIQKTILWGIIIFGPSSFSRPS
jgi:hypothetical protein